MLCDFIVKTVNSKMSAEGATNDSDDEISRCLSNCVMPNQMILWAKQMRISKQLKTK